ncbi:hypothetical protein O0L34_g2 [Tuta absoluta]|nr:hypothetical protein O0L34_g2 [Tuta absoluta]
MADDNTIIEGTVKFRDGKKWKSRWCVMRKLSPVADCVQLQLYRSARSRGLAVAGARGARGAGGARGACCAALSLQQFVGAESGFTLDKHSNTLALVCRDLVAVLAFETRERLIQWQVKVTAALGESRTHVVVVKGGTLTQGPAKLHIFDDRAALTSGAPPKLLGVWEIQHLRRYGVVEGRFCFEGGSLCGKGEGLHILVTDRPQDVARDFELAARGRLSPRRRPLPSKRVDGTESPSPAEAEPAWGMSRPEAGEEDTASVRDAPGAPIALERCMSCMSKLGALSRSSTAALTPGAKHFSPAWTMEALSEPPTESNTIRSPRLNETTASIRELNSPPPERPARPARLDLPHTCACDHSLDDAESSGIGPYENYDVPRLPSTEVEGEYYDTPKRLRECVDSNLFRMTRSSTANTLILKKPCGCLLRFGKKKREPTVIDAEEDLRPPTCPCQRVTDWANNWIKLPYCRRNTASSEPAASDKENMTPDASALYATIDFSRKTRRKTCGDQPVEIDTGPLAHYENLNFALSLEYYENAKDMLRKAGMTQTELNAISKNLKPDFAATTPRVKCKKCGHPPKLPPRRDTTDEYLLMEPNNIESNKLEQRKAPPSGYTPMSPIGGFAFNTLKYPAKSPINRLLEEKSASNPTLCVKDAPLTAQGERGPRGRPRSSSADSSRFLDDVKEFDGSMAGSASSLETLRDAAVNGNAPEGKLSDMDSSEASKGHEKTTRSPKVQTTHQGGNRDSSSSNDSGVSSWSLRQPPTDYELPRCTAAGRRHWRATRRPPPPRAPRPRSSDAPRALPPAEAPKSSSAEAEVPLLTLRTLRGVNVGTDSRSTSSGTSDMSDYIETLSLCSSHSSSDTPVTMRARVTSTLRPRSGKEYARLTSGGSLRPALPAHSAQPALPARTHDPH